MSKNARWPVVHTPLALMSSLASADLLAVLGIRFSPDNSDRFGSTQISLQTFPRRLAVMYRSSLCRLEIKPPFLHEMVESHTHFVGKRDRGQSSIK